MNLQSLNDRGEGSTKALAELQTRVCRLEALLESERTDLYQTREELRLLKAWSVRTSRELPKGLPLR